MESQLLILEPCAKIKLSRDWTFVVDDIHGNKAFLLAYIKLNQLQIKKSEVKNEFGKEYCLGRGTDLSVRSVNTQWRRIVWKISSGPFNMFILVTSYDDANKIFFENLE